MSKKGAILRVGRRGPEGGFSERQRIKSAMTRTLRQRGILAPDLDCLSENFRRFG